MGRALLYNPRSLWPDLAAKEDSKWRPPPPPIPLLFPLSPQRAWIPFPPIPQAATKRDPTLNHRFSAAAFLGPSLPPSLRWSPRMGAKKTPFLLPSVGRRGQGAKKTPFLPPSVGRRGQGAKKTPFLLPSGGGRGRERRSLPSSFPPAVVGHGLVCHRIIPPRRRRSVRRSSLTPLSSTWCRRPPPPSQETPNAAAEE